MIVIFPLRKLRLLFIVLFILVWGSIMLGFVQQQMGIGSFFRWGGAFGQIVAAWGTSYIQWIGMSLILLATLIIFCIVVDKHFVEHCQQLGHWIARLFKKKEEQ
jgi:S-DNA-T family DNA segregation ATPase FtsK/SpoIIIE